MEGGLYMPGPGRKLIMKVLTWLGYHFTQHGVKSLKNKIEPIRALQRQKIKNG